MFFRLHRRFRLIRQLDMMGCGPSCLAMVMEYYGKQVDIQEITSITHMSKNGISLRSISTAAESLGFKTMGGCISVNTLIEKAMLPCIVYWEQNHFVVVYKIKKNKKSNNIIIYVADPSKGFVKYAKDEFCEHWICTQSNQEAKGVVLLLHPADTFSEKKVLSHFPKYNFSFLWKYIKKYSFLFIQLSGGLFVVSIMQLIFPFLTQAIVDIGIGSKNIEFIWLVLIAQLMLLLSKTSVEFIQSKILLHISTRINLSLSSDFFIKLTKLPMRYFETKLSGDLIQRLEDNKRIERFLTSSSLNLIFSLFSFIIFGMVLYFYNLLIFIIFFLGSLLYAGSIFFFLKRRRLIDYDIFKTSGRKWGITYQLIDGMQEMKLQQCEQRKRWEWEDVQADLFDLNLKSLNLTQQQQTVAFVINELKNILITVLAATLVIKGNMTLGMMLAIQYILGQLNAPIDQLMQFIHSWQDVSLSLNRMIEIYKEKDENSPERNITHFDGCKTISIQNITFRYDNSKKQNVLENINLTIEENKVTAIVGASGSGKTTLLKLLLGYYTPQEGDIYLGNQNMKQLNLSWWREQCGVVMQGGYMFSDTIARNIAISDEELDFERIKAAAKLANIADYIEGLPLGYNTLIGQDGQGISEGQRQRILIARVIYKNPFFVFLDEATNSLDTSNERLIMQGMLSFYKEKTVVVVAHRLSTVTNADKIVVLNDGKIVEIGTHKDLIFKRGKYYELVRNQLELGE